MHHEISIPGYAYHLRPVSRADAQFIVELRNDVHLGRFIQKGASTPGDQLSWLDSYFERSDDYLFIVERGHDGRSEGMVGLYHVYTSEAEWGRWVLRPGSLAAADTVLGIFRLAFEVLKLPSVRCLTVSDNLPVLSFHDSAGLTRTGRKVSDVKLSDGMHEMTEHVLTMEGWPESSRSFENVCCQGGGYCGLTRMIFHHVGVACRDLEMSRHLSPARL